MKFRVYRYNPDQDEAPRMQDYDIALDHHDHMLLDALIRLKAHDDTLVFRRSCREGVCGSDAMNINGKNGLACITNLKDVKEPVELRPIPGLPVIRDLIVDMSQFFKQYHSIKPYLVNDTPPPEKERLQSPEEREELDGLYECILCACCSTACPSFWWNPDKFVGPAGLLAAYRFIADSQPRGSLPPVPLPYDHELRRRVPEEPESDQGNRQDQGTYGQAGGLKRLSRPHIRCDGSSSPRAVRRMPWHRALS
jgi:succinate dehydrogenase / fumarate reductase iron-sulfur subunit